MNSAMVKKLEQIRHRLEESATVVEDDAEDHVVHPTFEARTVAQLEQIRRELEESMGMVVSAPTVEAEAETAKAVRCDMSKTCEKPVAMIDDDGYAYCEGHGAQRKAGGRKCRKLTAAELKKLKSGQTISY